VPIQLFRAFAPCEESFDPLLSHFAVAQRAIIAFRKSGHAALCNDQKAAG
jgi:hypothetical protein